MIFTVDQLNLAIATGQATPHAIYVALHNLLVTLPRGYELIYVNTVVFPRTDSVNIRGRCLIYGRLGLWLCRGDLNDMTQYHFRLHSYLDTRREIRAHG